MATSSKSICTFRDALNIVLNDRYWNSQSFFEVWKKLCVAVKCIPGGPGIEYGVLIKMAKNRDFVSRLGHNERQVVERLAAFLDGEILDPREPKLTYTQLVSYNESLPADKQLNDDRIERLWLSVVAAGLEIHMRRDLLPATFKVRRSRVKEMATARHGYFRGIGEKSQAFLRDWLRLNG